MDWTDFILLATRVLATVSTAAITISAIIHQLPKKRTDRSKVTRRYVISGSLAAFLAVTASVAETMKSKYDDDKRAAATEETLRQFGRIIRPETKVEGLLQVVLSSEDPAVAAYLRRLDPLIKEMLPALEKEETIFRSQGENPFEIVEIARGSPLWPAANDAGMDLYDVTSIFVSFHKRVSEGPVWIWDYADLSASVEKPQFRMRRWTQGGKTELVLLVEFDSSKWTRRSGRVTSVPDLLGSEIIISLGFNYGETERKVSLRPRFLVLTVAEGVGFVFQSDQLRTLTMESGHPVISAIFPKTEVELEELSRIY